MSHTAPAPLQTAPAVEVVSMLGPSVVAVDTLRNPSAKKSHSRLVIGMGAALLAGAAIAFVSGVMTAKHDADAKAKWLREGRPAWAFRPSHSTPARDVMAFGGMLTGLGLVATGLLRKKDQARTSLRVGDSDLVGPDGRGGFVANLTGLTGDVRQGATVTPIASLMAAGTTSVPLHLDTHVRAQLDRTTFHIKGMEAPAASAAPALWVTENRALAFIAASAVAHLGVIAVLSMVPPEEQNGSGDAPVSEYVSVRANMTSTDDDPPPTPTADGDDGATGGAMSQIVSMAIEDGTLGAPDGSTTPARLKVKNRDVDPELARREAIEQAADAGILSAMDSPISVYNGGDIASGFDDEDIKGGLFDGGGTGGPVGSFGYGVKGFGQGCGRGDGKPCEGVHAGPFATTGWKGNRDYLGPLNRPGNGPGHDRTAKAPPVVLSKPVMCTAENPCLDEAIIRRYVHRNIEKISYCYEKELLAQPALQGTVTALFTLNGNGAVIESSATGVDPAVSSCIAAVVKNIKFPKVGETGVYPIKYPFVLHPTGS